MKKQIIKKLLPDFILFFLIAAAGGIIALIVLLNSPEGSVVEVTVDGSLYGSYPLSADRTVTISGAGGGTNLLVIENGNASIRSASCPDGVCIHTGRISRVGQSIICLPNKVVVRITGPDKTKDSTDIIVR